MADLLKDPVDRYRSLNLVLDVAGPVEDMDGPTTAMFMRFQRALLTLAREWHDLDLERLGAENRAAQPRAADHEPHAEVAAGPASANGAAAVATTPEESAA